MNLLLHPLTLYAALALTLAANLALFFSLKREIALLRRDSELNKQQLLAKVEVNSSSLANLGRALREEATHEVAPEAVAPVPAAVPLVSAASANLARRSQAIRRWRRGESADQIAQALTMPKAEVELLIKAYRASSGSPPVAGATAAAGASPA